MTFPFVAIVGQSLLKTALLISAIDPKIGGVLLSGPRGSAKSTVVRSLAALDECRPLITLPLGATEEMVVGSINLAKVMQSGEVAFEPGMFAKANEGFLYVDEVNLLPDHLVDLLLDVSITGVNQVERDGISYSHEARFVLVGTMNPDEGELRPQLLDRFGLMVASDATFTVEQRQQIVERRLEFDRCPEAFIRQYETETEALRRSLRRARQQVEDIVVPTSITRLIAQRCVDAKVDGLRADIALYRSARAHAALHHRGEVTVEDVNQVEELVFSHRRNPSTPDLPPGGAPSQSSVTGGGGPPSGSSIQGSWGVMAPQALPSGPELKLDNQQEKRLPADGRKQPVFSSGHCRSEGNALGAVCLPAPCHVPEKKKVHWFRTLIDPENRYAFRPQGQLAKLQFLVPRRQALPLDLILLDTSASTLGGQGIRKAKGLVKGVARRCYVLRRQLGIVTFGNGKVRTVLLPQRPPKDIDRILDLIPSGGGTPLFKALDHANRLLDRHPFKFQQCHVLLLTDGRIDIKQQGVHCTPYRYKTTVVDIESSQVKLGLSQHLATTLGAGYLHVDSLPMVH